MGAWAGGLEAAVGEWEAACEQWRRAVRDRQVAVRRADAAVVRRIRVLTGLSPAGFARHEAAGGAGGLPASVDGRRHREAVRRAGAEIAALREAAAELRRERDTEVASLRLSLAVATRRLLGVCPRPDWVTGRSISQLRRLCDPAASCPA